MTDLQATLQKLAARPYTESPFLSLYLDWTPDGNGQRAAPRIAGQELHRISGQVAEHGGARASFEADRQRILTYLDREAPADARALAIFACEADGVWETLPLQAHVDAEIAEDRYPHLFSLARVLDDYETYAVVLADGQQSRILLVGYADIRPAGATEAPEKIKRFDQGGQAQMLFQRRTDNLIKAHTKDIAEELGRVVARHDVRHVVVAANDSIKGIVMGTLPDAIKEKLVDYIKLDPNANIQEVMDALVPMMRQVEQEQDAAALAALEEQHYPDGLGIAGVAETALALSKGQVRQLLLRRNFAGRGGECPSCGTLRAGQRDKCPYDGAELRPVDLREAFTAHAIRQNAEIQVVENGDYLDRHEGVGALLRYQDNARTV
jgi:peptide subunit release factor 1 (eRF1)